MTGNAQGNTILLTRKNTVCPRLPRDVQVRIALGNPPPMTEIKKELPAWKHFMTPVCAEFAHALMRHDQPLMTSAEVALGTSPQDDMSSSGSDSEPEQSTRTPLKTADGFSMAPTMTEDEDLMFHITRKYSWATVDQYILCKWPYCRWVSGRVVRGYRPARLRYPPGYSPISRCTMMRTIGAQTTICYLTPTILTNVKKPPIIRGSGSSQTLIRLGGMRPSAEQ